MENDYLKNIKNIRIEKGISQKDMANKLQFAQSNYNKIENGLSELTVKRLYEIAEILGVSVFQILIDKDVEILQEKIRFEIESKQRKEFIDKEVERIVENHKNKIELEIEESVRKWFDDIGTQISNAKLVPKKPKTEEEKKQERNKRFEGLEK
jgi:transcriptional regulator with XRE-family HTH domain